MKIIYLEMLFLSIVLALLILPGIYFVNIMAHEIYHAKQHTPYTERICFSTNKTYEAFTIVDYPNESMRNEFTEEMRIKEEKIADRTGRLTAIIYLIFFVLIMVWLLSLIKRHETKIIKKYKKD